MAVPMSRAMNAPPRRRRRWITLVAVAVVAATAGAVVARRGTSRKTEGAEPADTPSSAPGTSASATAPRPAGPEEIAVGQQGTGSAGEAGPRPHWAVMLAVGGVSVAAVGIGVWAARTDPAADPPAEAMPPVTATLVARPWDGAFTPLPWDGTSTSSVVTGVQLASPWNDTPPPYDMHTSAAPYSTERPAWTRTNTTPVAGPSGSTIPPAHTALLEDLSGVGAAVTVNSVEDKVADGQRTVVVRVLERNVGSVPFTTDLEGVWITDTRGVRYDADMTLTKGTGWVVRRLQHGAEGELPFVFVLAESTVASSLHLTLAGQDGVLPLTV